MGNVRGLRTRLCPKCNQLTPHRNLYTKTESGGRTRWLQLFWVCSECDSLNHVLLPRYRLESASAQLPSAMAIGVVTALADGSLDFGELVTALKLRRVPEVRHIFSSDVAMALEYLKGRGVVGEEDGDRTERTLDDLRARLANSGHLRKCPIEEQQGFAIKSLISLYFERWISAAGDDHRGATKTRRMVPVGALCLSCGYTSLDSSRPLTKTEIST